MEKYERKIKVKKELTTIDTNNDGIEDTIVYINSDDLFISVILKQTIKDLGVYTDYEEEPEIIDLDNLWDTTHDGVGDGGTNPIFDGEIVIEYDEDESFDDDFDLDFYGCTDPEATNYSETATIDDDSCEYPPVPGCTDPNANNYDPEATINDQSCEYDDIEGGGSIQGGCFKISSQIMTQIQLNVIYTVDFMTARAQEWCQATHEDCVGITEVNCEPNGCLGLGDGCCPGPPLSLQLLTVDQCQEEGFDCDGQGCDCVNDIPQQIFGGIKYSDTPVGNAQFVRIWQFYCVPS